MNFQTNNSLQLSLMESCANLWWLRSTPLREMLQRPYILADMSTRQELLDLISRLPEEKIQQAYWAIDRLSSNHTKQAERARQEWSAFVSQAEVSLRNLQKTHGARPVSGSGGTSKITEDGQIVDASFTQHWYEDNDNTMVQQINWIFRKQGFLITHRIRLTEDGSSYSYSQEIAGPEKNLKIEELFPVIDLPEGSKK
jgi:hypothetical protein